VANTSPEAVEAIFARVQWLVDKAFLGDTVLNEPPLFRITSRASMLVDYSDANAADGSGCGRYLMNPCATLPFAVRQLSVRPRSLTTIVLRTDGSGTVRLSAKDAMTLGGVETRLLGARRVFPASVYYYSAQPLMPLVTIDCGLVAGPCLQAGGSLSLVLRGLRLFNASTALDAGSQAVAVRDCEFDRNRGVGARGAAIALVSGGRLSVQRTRFVFNEAAADGSVVSLYGGQAAFSHCEWYANRAGGSGGAIQASVSGDRCYPRSKFQFVCLVGCRLPI
jgi:hypothetical protein